MSLLLGIASMKCPRCRRGKLFIDPNPYNLKMLTKMPEKCSHCGQMTEPEPAFYYGAMYLSYGLSIVLSFVNYFVFEVLFNAKGPLFLTLNALVLLVLWPVIFRYARVLYIYMFIRYNPQKE